MSIGQNAFIKDKCFYVKNNNIYVAAPILLLETIEKETDVHDRDEDDDEVFEIEINGEDFNFDINNNPAKLYIDDINSNSGLFVSSSAEFIGYTIDVFDLKTYMEIELRNVNKTDIVLTKKEVVKDFNKTISYGLTAMDGTEENPFLGWYPCGYSENAITSELAQQFDGQVINFEMYVLNKGYTSAEFHVFAQA